ncbi:unnamed protein product [Symbiodinium sp. CCMP2456]|nr:unnamed protein product [Symbiodinium sp. CCMP2456]
MSLNIYVPAGYDTGARELCLLGCRDKLQRVRVYVDDGELLLDIRRRDGRFPIALQDVRWEEPKDVLTVFDLCVPEQPELQLAADAETAEQPELQLAADAKTAASPVSGALVVGGDDSAGPRSARRQHRKGRKRGEKDWTFSQRMKVLQYAKTENFIRPHASGVMVNNLPAGERYIKIPWLAGEECESSTVAVDTVLDWSKQSVQQRWQDMVDSQDLCNELGAGWPDRRSRLPNSWRSVLNDTQCSNYARLGQPRLLDKHPELLGVVQKTDSMHADERQLLAPASTQGFLDTLQTQLQLAREEQADAGEAAASSSALPSKVSRSWVQTQLRGLKAQEIKKPCTQPNVVTEKDKADYIAGLKRKLAKIGDVRLQLSWDEFSATVDDGQEVHWCAANDDGWHLKHFLSSEKISVLSFTYMSRPRAVYMASAIGQMLGLFIPLYASEDHAPCHVGDADTVTKATGLQQRRREALVQARLLRHLVPLNGTPDFCKNDQVHDILKKEFAARLQELSLRARDFSRRPSPDLRKNGGISYSAKGYHRCPGKYLIAKAFAETLEAFPNSRCLAAHIRCGALTPEAATAISTHTSEEVLLAVNDLQKLQAEVRAEHKYKHPCASGVDRHGGRASPAAWLDIDWKWLQPAKDAASSPPTQEQLQELEVCRAASDKLRSLRARTLLELVEAEAPQGPLPELNLADCQPDGTGALVRLCSKPGPNNADQSLYFQQAAQEIFKHEAKMKSKRELIVQALDFQLFQLQQAYLQARLSQAPAVRRVSRSEYCWNALRQAHRSSNKATLLNHILGDYQKFGLNSSGRVDRKSAKAEAQATEVIDLDAIPDSSHVPQKVTDEAKLRKLQAWREGVVSAKRKAAEAADKIRASKKSKKS